jgi:hypothetical protein
MRTEKLPTEPVRIKAFASFFRNYMGVSSFVVAALPIPATVLSAIPTFSDDRLPLSIYTSLFCFLTLSFIFYMRHWIAAHMFPLHIYNNREEEIYIETVEFIRVLPAILSCGTLIFIFLYHVLLDSIVIDIAKNAGTLKSNAGQSCSDVSRWMVGKLCNTQSRQEILSGSYIDLSGDMLLKILYIGIFVTAEAAFVLMATREYIQDLLGLTDGFLLKGTK